MRVVSGSKRAPLPSNKPTATEEAPQHTRPARNRASSMPKFRGQSQVVFIEPKIERGYGKIWSVCRTWGFWRAARSWNTKSETELGRRQAMLSLYFPVGQKLKWVITNTESNRKVQTNRKITQFLKQEKKCESKKKQSKIVPEINQCTDWPNISPNTGYKIEINVKSWEAYETFKKTIQKKVF